MRETSDRRAERWGVGRSSAKLCVEIGWGVSFFWGGKLEYFACGENDEMRVRKERKDGVEKEKEGLKYGGLRGMADFEFLFSLDTLEKYIDESIAAHSEFFMEMYLKSVRKDNARLVLRAEKPLHALRAIFTIPASRLISPFLSICFSHFGDRSKCFKV